MVTLVFSPEGEVPTISKRIYNFDLLDHRTVFHFTSILNLSYYYLSYYYLTYRTNVHYVLYGLSGTWVLHFTTCQHVWNDNVLEVLNTCTPHKINTCIQMQTKVMCLQRIWMSYTVIRMNKNYQWREPVYFKLRLYDSRRCVLLKHNKIREMGNGFA